MDARGLPVGGFPAGSPYNPEQGKKEKKTSFAAAKRTRFSGVKDSSTFGPQ